MKTDNIKGKTGHVERKGRDGKRTEAGVKIVTNEKRR
jgi:hypothetical protein